MIDIASFDFNKVHLLKYKDEVNKEDIPLIFIEKINNSTYMNCDYLMIKHYGQGGEQYLKLVLMFNNKNDISDINIGDYLRIPDLNSLLVSLELIDDNMDGIMDFNDINMVENTEIFEAKQSKDGRKTTANPRLNITLERPKFNDSVVTY